jgi:hypothetical protein
MHDIWLETACRVEKSLLILFGCDDIREPDNNLLAPINIINEINANGIR